MTRGCSVFLLIAAAILASAGWMIRPSVIQDFVVQCDHLPPDDEKLVAWLQEYPYVAPLTVHVERKTRQLRVIFVQNRNLFGFPSFPPLEQKCRELGYELNGRTFQYNE